MTDDNKEMYVELMIDWTYHGKVQKQIDAIRFGMNFILPIDFLIDFTSSELEVLVCGQKKIEVEDWKKNTRYLIGYNVNSTTIVNFWKVIIYQIKISNKI